MDIHQLAEFFKWNLIISGGLYIFSVIAVLTLKNFMFGIHERLFGLSKETVNIAVYSYIGLFKLLFIVFVFAPYVALCLMTSH